MKDEIQPNRYKRKHGTILIRRGIEAYLTVGLEYDFLGSTGASPNDLHRARCIGTLVRIFCLETVLAHVIVTAVFKGLAGVRSRNAGLWDGLEYCRESIYLIVLKLSTEREEDLKSVDKTTESGIETTQRRKDGARVPRSLSDRIERPSADAVRGMASHIGLVLPAATAVGTYSDSVDASMLA
jgi:hypothetical protein